MEYRYLGRSGLRVSTLALGTMTFGGQGAFSNTGSATTDDARHLIDIAMDHGVNLFDTANMYSDGLSEQILGEALRGRRDHAVVATKVRMSMGDGPNDSGLSRAHIIAQCEASLRRLQTDHIDLYQTHEWDGITPLEETLSAFDALIASGKVRYIGCSNYAGWQLMKALGTSSTHGYQRFVSQQIHYSLQAREAEYELLPVAVDQGVGVLVWSPLAGGLLSGKHRRGVTLSPGSRDLSTWGEPPVRDREALYDIVEVLIEIGEERDATAAQVALAWLKGRPGISSLVIGARTPEQLVSNLAAAQLELDASERERLDSISAPALIYPYWHHARSAPDRLGPADIAPAEALRRKD
ncbi:aldo/keto reductase [Microbacterium tumbae]